MLSALKSARSRERNLFKFSRVIGWVAITVVLDCYGAKLLVLDVFISQGVHKL